jgi:hypothetical protein
LQLDTGGVGVFECPRLRLERLEASGKVAETRDQPLPVSHLPRAWNEGWDGATCLLVEFATGTLTPGTWRITVVGTAGKEKTPLQWTAEPRTFVLRPLPGTPPAPGIGGAAGAPVAAPAGFFGD